MKLATILKSSNKKQNMDSSANSNNIIAIHERFNQLISIGFDKQFNIDNYNLNLQCNLMNLLSKVII